MEMIIKDKQQKLAVEMWEYIKEQISKDDPRFIVTIKEEFIKKHGLQGKWINDCWLCENVLLNCSMCLLCDCKSSNSVYLTVSDVYALKQKRLDACDKIIQVIKNTDRHYVLKDGTLTTVTRKKYKFVGTWNECLYYIGEGEKYDEI